jgi:hypothetical protein
MTFGKNTIVNNGSKINLTVAKNKGQIKFRFFQVKITLGHDLCLTYGNTNREKIIGDSIMISANADLTPKWKLGFQLVMILYKMELLILNLDLKEIYLAGEWTSTGPFGTNANWDSLLE